MERELFICSCENTEHQIAFSWFEDDDVANVYATTHLSKKSFWKRLKYGIKYIFGYQSKYGAFDEFIFNPNDARRLQKVVDFLKEEGTREEEILKVAEQKAYEPTKLMSSLVPNKVISAYEIGFIEGAVWSDEHPHWISVRDKLPPKKSEYDDLSNNVLATDGKEIYESVYNHNFEEWFTLDMWGLDNITHWMPLPSVYHLRETTKMIKKGGEE